MRPMKLRLRPGWRRAVLLHLAGFPLVDIARVTGYTYDGLRHLLRHPRMRQELPRLLEEAAALRRRHSS
jgi:hypothetical protein